MQQKMSVAARRRMIVYIIEQVILTSVVIAVFCGTLIGFSFLLDLI